MKTPPPDYARLDHRRQTLLDQLADLRELRRGSLTDQFLELKHADGSIVKRGPYPLFTRKEGGKTLSVRLNDPAVVSLYRQQIQALRQFESVVDQLIGVGEQLSDLVVAEVVQKKTPGGTGAKRRGASPGPGPGHSSES
jgi:Family of unknown function (DUF6788)